ncbi:four helix bundle protein [Anditalea andensis]|uniref:four helix bundle protein n=1 Tax=Anditalea andensis TaxID=1048983 RepID=UPI000691B0DA|nr:four helix bundle protein [Anditalea andensis]
MKQSMIKVKSNESASRLVGCYVFLKNEKRASLLSKKVLRSGIALGTQIEEALQGNSKVDFLQNLPIVYHEANETSLLDETFKKSRTY